MPKKFTVLICGGRNFGINKSEHDWILDRLDNCSMDWPKLLPDSEGNWLPDVRVISGKARGVDSCAIDWAVINWLDFKEYPANWELYGKRAGPIRNEEMLIHECPDVVVAFQGGKGTAHMVKIATKAGIKVIQIEEYKDAN